MSMFALLFMVAQAAPAAPSAPVRDQLGFDIRCMVASQAASDKTDGAMKANLQLASMFYFGRVDSVLSGTALEQRLGTESKALENKPLAPVLQQCGEFMEARGKTLQAIGAKLEAREKASQVQ